MNDDVLIPVLLSLKVAVLATLAVFVTGIIAARLLARRSFPGKELIEAMLLLPMVLPPTIVGFGLLILFGKHGLFGALLDAVFHHQVIFTWWAAVIASMIVAFPLMYQSARAAFASVDVNQESAARTLGANEWRVFFTVTLPLAWPGIVSGIVLAFARALGEFGATLMVAGNIPGKTQTIPIAVYFAVEAGDYQAAIPLVSAVVVFSLGLISWLDWWSKTRVLHPAERRRR